MSDSEDYLKFEAQRKWFTDAIINSDEHKKIVIAGPGTGKSFLFKQICKENIKKGKSGNIVLSFINELINDLQRDLNQLAEARTLHSFALSQIPQDHKYYMKLGQIIEEDYYIAEGIKVKFDEMLCNLQEDEEALAFYSKRRKFYDHFGPNCSVYALIKIYENNKKVIPEYSQILVDEFQDFNRLEARLVDLLSEKSPTLIVGDDDQSLYSFKYANPDQIRERHSSGEYSPFNLPFCNRCTKTVIKAFNNIIDEAKNRGFFKKRIIKKFIYFPSTAKDEISNQNPKIILKTQLFQQKVAHNIEKEIKKICSSQEELPSILIVCPFKKHIPNILKGLTEKGFKNIETPKKVDELEIMEGFNFLLDDENCNLGWRIIARNLSMEQFKEAVKKSCINEDNKFMKLLEDGDVSFVKEILRFLKRIKKGNDLLDDENKVIFDLFGYDASNLAIKKLKNDFFASKCRKINIGDIPIKITTILGSKGLTSDYVFLVNFDDNYILEKDGEISEDSICSFLVALTRARKGVSIYTCKAKPPEFVNWIDPSIISID